MENIISNTSFQTRLQKFTQLLATCIHSTETIAGLRKISGGATYPYVRDRIPHQQFVFMSKRSTVTQLIFYLDSIYGSNDLNEPTYAFYVEFSKAFDKVSHDILLPKLRAIGISGKLLQLLHPCLINRKQCVRVREHVSPVFSISSGVPQGFILGSLLFIISIDDLLQTVTEAEIFLQSEI